jgi:hypothetical protein
MNVILVRLIQQNSLSSLIILLSAILEARTATNERDSLRERLRVNKNLNISIQNLEIYLQIVTDTGLNERARSEQRIEDLEIDLRKVKLIKFQLRKTKNSFPFFIFI